MQVLILDNSQVVLSNLERFKLSAALPSYWWFWHWLLITQLFKTAEYINTENRSEFCLWLRQWLRRWKWFNEAVLSMAKSFSLETVAEGVETETQLLLKPQHGCHVACGYYLAKPWRLMLSRSTWLLNEKILFCACEQEELHLSGAVQSFGAWILTEENGYITYVSVNTGCNLHVGHSGSIYWSHVWQSFG